MKKRTTRKAFSRYALFFLVVVAASCKKEKPAPEQGLVRLGLYEAGSGNDKRIFIPITIGATPLTYYGIFDTGSTGMTLDASGILPDSMITSTGIRFTGDSININGITVTSKQSVMAYGDLTSSTKEYGYLAYAPVTLGNENGKITTKRIPFFLYYKIVDGAGKQLSAHSSDVFGVGPGVSYASSAIASPLSYFDMPSGITNGFKLATLSSSGFNTTGIYVSSLLTIGLSQSDLNSSGFIMHSLSYLGQGGYSANIPATISYNGKTISAQVLFDTGTPSVTIIEDRAANALGSLPVNSVVTVTTNKGFVYQYTTTTTGNLTSIQNPNYSGDTRTIFSLDFFIKNEYLTDYMNHQIGLKNN